MYYNRKGEEIDKNEWVKLYNNLDYRIVQRTTLSNNVWVSTIWIGLADGYEGGLFETKVFETEGTKKDKETQYYTTEEEALKGHKEMCEKYK